jgi:hypothetical protein
MAADLGSHFSVSAFSGLPAAYSEENGSGGDTIYGETQAQFYALGVGGQVVPDLITLKLALNYARDPYYDEDVSAILSLLLDL